MNSFQELGGPFLSDEMFAKFSAFLFEHSGIELQDHKKYLVFHRLSQYVGKGKPFPTFENYYEVLTKKPVDAGLLKQFLDRLTTNFSFFFRDEIHFDFLKKCLHEFASRNEPIRIWSAAASTGEEAYSIAITVLLNEPSLESKDFKILGTDISTEVLNAAHEGSYEAAKLKNHVPQDVLQKFFTYNPKLDHYKVIDRLKKMIAFRRLNLLGDYPLKKQFDIVFLRNVLIYFNNNEKSKVINKISHFIKPGGYLIAGLSESFVGVEHSLKSLKYSIYQKEE